MRLKLYLLPICAAVVATIFSCQQQDLENQSPSQDKQKTRLANLAAYQGVTGAVEGKVRIKFKRGSEPKGLITLTEGGIARTGVQSVDAVSSRVGAYQVERVIAPAGKFEDRIRKAGLDLWYNISFDQSSGARLSAVVNDFQQLEEVDFVETVKYVEQADKGEIVPVDINEMMARSRADVNSYPFDDPMLGEQWHYDVGRMSAPRSASINLFTAWESVAGTSDIIVAVVDGGISNSHPDLVDNLWINAAERNGKYGVDDDENGKIDDIFGFNYVTMSGSIVSSSHGTHVAGTVAAVNNNGIGVCGVAGGTGNKDGVKLMSCQILSDGGSGADDSNMSDAYVYSANNGAVISQNSWCYTQQGQRSAVVEEAIDYFIENAGNAEHFPNSPMRGGVVIVGSGNSDTDAKYYPAAYEPCISVAATDHTRGRASYSNYGYIDISAPGGHKTIENMKVLSTINTDPYYGYKYGTSMACPHVSGVAALLIQANRGITGKELEKKLMESVAELKIEGMGSGLLDASKFLSSVNDNKAPEDIRDLEFITEVVENEDGDKTESKYLSWKVPAETALNRVAKYTVYYSAEMIDKQNLSNAKSFELTQYVWRPTGSVIKHDMAAQADIKLDGGTTYFFAIVSADKWDNTSGLSNVVNSKGGGGTTGDSEVVLSAVLVNSNMVTVSWKAEFAGAKIVRMYDAAGRVVYKNAIADETVRNLDIKLNGVAAGSYVVEVGSDAKVVRTKFRKI